jgi:hypothetical protein
MKLLAAFPLILVLAATIAYGSALIWSVATSGVAWFVAVVFGGWFVVGTLYLIAQNQ